MGSLYNCFNMIGLTKGSRIVYDGLDLAGTDLNIIKKDIFNTYDKLARKSGEEYIEEEGCDKFYIFHGLKFTKTGELYDVQDTSVQKVLNSFFPDETREEDSIIIHTEYYSIKNRFILYIILEYLKSIKL